MPLSLRSLIAAVQRYLGWISIFLSILVVGFLAILFNAPPSPSTTSLAAPWGKDYLPNVDVVDHNGRKLKFYDGFIAGKIVVFSFIYTSCQSICPVMTGRLRDVQERLGDAVGRDIFFVSISIDPIPDTPDKLKKYAEAFKVGPGWAFITGEPAHIDYIRHKLGERSGQTISQHKNEVLLFNDKTGEWSRDSAFSDLGVLVMNIRAMNPAWRDDVRRAFVSSDAATLTVDRPGQALFIKACAACHSIGGGEKVGPDLAGVIGRRGPEWVAAYVMRPEKVRGAGDPIARALMTKYPAVRMPNLGIADTDAADLISYLEAVQSERRAAGSTPLLLSGTAGR